MMVFVPAGPDRLREWRSGSGLDVEGFAATTAMRSAHEFGPGEVEDAEFVALGYASVAGLVEGLPGTSARRWVAAVDADDVTPGVDADFGTVAVTGARWPQVAAIFVDDADAAEAVRRVTRAVSAMEVTEALTDSDVLEFVAGHELLWHLPSELDTLL